MRWRIYYTDGSTWDDNTVPGSQNISFSKSWLASPSDGIVLVKVWDDSGRQRIFDNRDHYFQMPTEGHGQGEIGYANDLGPYLRSLGVCKFGLWTSSDNFKKILDTARGDQ